MKKFIPFYGALYINTVEKSNQWDFIAVCFQMAYSVGLLNLLIYFLLKWS